MNTAEKNSLVADRMDPLTFFSNQRILVLVPHMDDAVLGLGGLLAAIPDKSRLRLVYCTDGRGSMTERERSHDFGTERDIGIIRHNETLEALAVLGYQPNQLTFLNFDEWKLAANSRMLYQYIVDIVADFKPEIILFPSRYDKHTDHLALSQAGRRIVTEQPDISAFEYFVYWQWKLLPGGDIRKYIRAAHLLEYDISAVANLKREALEKFVSQTSIFYDWQHKPVLSSELLDRFCRQPELFMQVDPKIHESDILTIPPPLIHLLNRLEPLLKNTKEKLLTIRHCKFGRKKVSS